MHTNAYVPLVYCAGLYSSLIDIKALYFWLWRLQFLGIQGQIFQGPISPLCIGKTQHIYPWYTGFYVTRHYIKPGHRGLYVTRLYVFTPVI